MRLLATLALSLALEASGQQPSFTLDQVLAFSFPSDLTAAPAGAKVAWFSNTRGVRNIMVAEPPRYEARKVTNYTEDDGQELQHPGWLPDASAIVYTRGGTANPASDPRGVSEDIWMVGLDGSAPRRIAAGSGPVVSPRGDRIAFLRAGQIWWASTDGKTPAAQAFDARGTCEGPEWSPDGDRIAFTTNRGDHSLIGVYQVSAGTLRYLDPSTDFDGAPAWSPDGRSVAFIRIPSSGLRPVREARRAREPWSIRMASVETGAGREIWRAAEGRGSVFREVSGANQLLWADGKRIVFPWEADGWTHLYSIAAEGGRATLLTPGEFEVEDAAPARSRGEVVF